MDPVKNILGNKKVYIVVWKNKYTKKWSPFQAFNNRSEAEEFLKFVRKETTTDTKYKIDIQNKK